MKSLTHYLFISIFIISTAANAQTKQKAKANYTVTFGPDLKLKGDLLPTNILLYDNGNFYAIMNKDGFWNKTDYLSKFNSDMNIVDQKTVETEKSSSTISDHKLVRIMEFNKAIYAISREKDSKNKKSYYFAEKIDLNTLVPDGKKIKVYEGNYANDKKLEDIGFNFITDKSKTAMVMYHQDEAEKNQNIKITVIGLDKSLSETWRKTAELPIAAAGKKFRFEKYVDPAGNIYMLSKVYYNDGTSKKTKDVKEGMLNYDYHIYMVGKDVDGYSDYALKLKDKAVSQLHMDVNAQGNLVACGLYSDLIREKDKASDAKGVFFATIDAAKKEVKAQNYKPFTNEVFTAGLSAKKAAKADDKGDDDDIDYIIRDLVSGKDGSSIMTAEQYFYYSTDHAGYMRHSYNYKNIIVTKVNAAGEIEWMSVIPKYQQAEIERPNNGFSDEDWRALTSVCSYLAFPEDNGSYDFFFNDSKDNLNPAMLASNGVATVRTSGRVKNMRLVRVVVNADGSQSPREEAYKMTADDEDTRICPMESKALTDREIILYGVQHRKDKFAKISYK